MSTIWNILKSQGEKGLYFSFFLIMLSALFCLAYIYPICSDDFLYGCVWKEYIRISSWGDIWRSQIAQYESLNGRVLANSLIQIILLFHRSVYASLNTVCFVLCVLGICHIAKQINIFTLLLVALVFEPAVPYISWRTGSITYLWMSVVMLFFLALVFSGNKRTKWLALILAIPAGNCHEALSAGALAAMFFYAIMNRRLFKDWSYILSFVLLFIGFCSNALAPATFVRMAHMQTDIPYDDSITAFTIRIQKLTFAFASLLRWHPHIGALLSMALGACIYQLYTKRYHCKSIAFIGAAVVSAIIAFAANAIYPAAMYGMSFYCLLAVAVVLLPRCEIDSYHSNRALRLLFRLIPVLCLSCSFALHYQEHSQKAEKNDRLEKYVAEQAHKGLKTIEIPEHWDGASIAGFGNFNNFISNRYAAAYYGVEPFAVFKTPEEISILHDKTNFNELGPGSRKLIKHNRILYALAAKPKAVKCVFYPGDEYKLSGPRGHWLSKDAQHMPLYIAPAVFERDGKYYAMTQLPETSGRFSITIQYEDAGLAPEEAHQIITLDDIRNMQ